MSNEPNKSGTKPAIQHSKSILDDRRIRLLLAIVGAIVAWMVVPIVVQPGTTKTIANVFPATAMPSAASRHPISSSTRTGPVCATAARRPCICRCGASTAC